MNVFLPKTPIGSTGFLLIIFTSFLTVFLLSLYAPRLFDFFPRLEISKIQLWHLQYLSCTLLLLKVYDRRKPIVFKLVGHIFPSMDISFLVKLIIAMLVVITNTVSYFSIAPSPLGYQGLFHLSLMCICLVIILVVYHQLELKKAREITKVNPLFMPIDRHNADLANPSDVSANPPLVTLYHGYREFTCLPNDILAIRRTSAAGKVYHRDGRCYGIRINSESIRALLADSNRIVEIKNGHWVNIEMVEAVKTLGKKHHEVVLREAGFEHLEKRIAEKRVPYIRQVLKSRYKSSR